MSSRSTTISFHEFHAARCFRPSGLNVRKAPAACRLAAAISAASSVHAFQAIREPRIRMLAATLSIACFLAAAASTISFQPFRHLRCPCSISEEPARFMSSRSTTISFHEFHAARCFRPSGLNVRKAPAACRLAAAISAASSVHAFQAIREPRIRMLAATLSIACFLAAAASTICFQPFRHLRCPCSMNDEATPRISARSCESSRHEFQAARFMRPAGLNVRKAPAACRLAAPSSAATSHHALSARRTPS